MDRFKKYLKVLTILTILAAGLFGFAIALKFGLMKGLFAGAIFGAIFGIFMTVIFIPVDFLLTRKLPPEALSVRQEKTVRVKGEFTQVFEKSIEILKGFKPIKEIEPLIEKQTISARTKTSIASFGEDINLEFKPLNQETTEIHISSSPVVRYTLLDFGKNFKNVERISRAIMTLNLTEAN